MNINFVEYTLIVNSLKAYISDDHDKHVNEDIKSLIRKIEHG
tara:strand:- start:160 stop:285 length:126 start_codon:yes stop_codon:yes gene_type:complete